VQRNSAEPRNNCVNSTPKFPEKRMSYASTVHDVLNREYGPLRNAAKILARKADVSSRTAQNWLHGKCAPRGDELIRLMAECGALKDEIDRQVEALKSK
jgi:hypothetical protein